MTKKTAYQLIDSIKEAGANIKDQITGRSLAIEIEEELLISKVLSPFNKTEPALVLSALRSANILRAHAIDDATLNILIKKYLAGEIKP